MQTIVNATNLVKRYKELLALDHFNLKIEEGEILGLLGPNGSGKTTAINCLLSLLTIDKGEVDIFGKRMSPTSYSIKQEIGVVPQQVAVFEELTTQENIDYFCGLYVKDKQLRKELVDEAIDFVELDEFRKFHPKKLSGGLLRRLNIACGIAHKPKLIILDEPTVAVDPQSRAHILDGIVKLNEQGATIIYTSHYMEEVEQICTRIVIMDKGRCLAEGTSEELKRMIKAGETIRIELPAFTGEQMEGIKALPHVYSASYADGLLAIYCEKGGHNVLHVLDYLQKNDIPFGTVDAKLPTLNDVFLEITGRELRDGGESE
ncbi:ABC transporter ATP-binding protein [Christensenellaceae bacterium OttesenSCG-928-K19]|nr:ABC transporter ATP-binding protein [Christensenellaceae bacterium OttesenSCG-928-K19]